LDPAHSNFRTHLRARLRPCSLAFLVACGFPDVAFDPSLGSDQGGADGPSDDGAEGGSPEGSGPTVCTCSGGQAPYPTGIACAAISALGLPPGQAQRACARASGFVESAIPCGQKGTYVTCDVPSGGGGQVACIEVARINLVQGCHSVGGDSGARAAAVGAAMETEN